MYFPRSFFRCAVFRVSEVALCFAAVCATATAQFEERGETPFPEGAWSIATGDFNHDGRLDVVMMVDGGFAVALGNGDGTFERPVPYRTRLAYSLAVGDFNNDGNLDIAVANLVPNSVSIYLGNGDGTFQTLPIDSITTAGSYFIAAGDFNDDRKLDLAIIDPPYISVLLGKGDGTFLAPSDNDSFDGSKWLAIADFNNDHKADVLVAGTAGGIYSIGILLGNGDGTLQNAITQSALFVPASVAAGDLNGDGNMDAVLGYDLGGIAVLMGNGDGTLQLPTVYDTTGIGSGCVVISDFGLDGGLDVGVPSTLGLNSVIGIDIFWGNGDGTLQDAQLFPGAGGVIPAVGDFNGDGLPDISIGGRGVETTLNTGVVSLRPSTALIFSGQAIDTIGGPQMVTLTNKSTVALTIKSLRVSGPFRMGSTCGGSVAAGSKCTISVSFKPTVSGIQTGLITLVDSASSRPQFIELVGSTVDGEAVPVPEEGDDQD